MARRGAGAALSPGSISTGVVAAPHEKKCTLSHAPTL
jgi:hypothetical protein